MKPLAHRLVLVLGLLACVAPGLHAASAIPIDPEPSPIPVPVVRPLKYSPRSYQAAVKHGRVVKFPLTVTSPKEIVTAAAPEVTPVKPDPIPAQWVSASPGEATFGAEGTVFVISISVPKSAPPGLHSSRIGARVIKGKATDGNGCTVTLEVVANQSPTAAFTWEPANPVVGDSVQFHDSSHDADGTIVAWAWDFGDGITSDEQHPVHQFSAPGEYAVALAVTDDDGDVSSYSAVVAVAATPKAPEQVTVAYDGARLVSPGSALRLAASALDMLGEDRTSLVASLIRFAILDSQCQLVADAYASQAAPSAPLTADVTLAPGIYRIYAIFPGSRDYAPASADSELVVVAPAGADALASWGKLEGTEAQFALLAAPGGDGTSPLREFAYWDAASADAVTSTSVDAVTSGQGAWQASGVCTANGVHGHRFQVQLAQASGRWVFTLEVSNGLLIRGIVIS